ncbi:sensor histidine kinase [Aureimonas populi]|uniref:histidine kinase n=1 Tax=Aureimonas populi TaxID=1701758 RepID=A0ABW5CHU7_9HYPH|nr:HAMP domain-containing sensor histidine kinase [Aureimonas populi]
MRDRAVARGGGHRNGERRRKARAPLPHHLAARLVRVTMIAILIAEAVIFVPSVAHFRKEWLRAKLEAVAVASFASGSQDGGPMPSPAREAELLRALEADLIAVESDGVSRLLARSADVPTVDLEIDLARESTIGSITGAMETLALGRTRTLRVLGPIGDGSMVAEAVISERPLKSAMVAFSINIVLVSLLIALFAGLLVNLAIHRALVGPIRRLTESMVRFGEDPENPARIIEPSPRNDEIGVAERELSQMQSRLARTLREQRHLADLGLAVAKINHDLRNTLASAQLVSDRLSDIEDPQVQRFAPTLIRSLDRALSYTRSVLAYGRAVEERPVKRRVRLAFLVDEILEAPATAGDSGTELVNGVPRDLEVDVDPDQFHRALSNLVKNAVDALAAVESAAVVRRVQVEAREEPDGGCTIAVEDTGPGLSEPARNTLFQAFRGSTRAGGTGLGLAIAAEIVKAHGGTIRYAERAGPGARFEIELPPRDDEAAPAP